MTETRFPKPDPNQERADALFERLAREEPPLDLQNDTAPAKTAPRTALPSGDTRPVLALQRTRERLGLTLALGVVLVLGIGLTLFLLLAGGSEDSTPIVEATTLTPSPSATPPQASPLPPTPSPLPTKNDPLSRFAVTLPPTAAADERGAWLLTPVAPSTNGQIGQVSRQDGAFTLGGGVGRLEVVTYTVEAGDTLTRIAERFGLEICSIVWANPRNKVSPLRPGNVLDILPVDGVLFRVEKPITIQAVAEQTGVEVYTIIDSPFNQLFGTSPETQLIEGMKIVVPSGKLGDCNIWAPPAGGNASAGGGGGGGGSLWGCSYSVDAPGFATVIPVSGRYDFFQGFSAGHTGVDLAASPGTPVLSAGSGAVAFAGWNEYGYGNAIVVDHGGTYTLYAHLSQINVSCGQQVGAGQVIGAVGSTGRSSGPHLHFEIRDSGFNPLDPTYSMGL